MEKELRKRFDKHNKQEQIPPLPQGHRERFLDRLNKEMPKASKPSVIHWGWSAGIAASIILGGVLTYYVAKQANPRVNKKEAIVQGQKPVDYPETISLGDLSPELQKIEQYYVSHINYELTQLTTTVEHQELVDGYLQQLHVLNKDYQELNAELNDLGPNEDIVSALIQNLQLRLQLLKKLKEKLYQLKSSKNEQESYTI